MKGEEITGAVVPGLAMMEKETVDTETVDKVTVDTETENKKTLDKEMSHSKKKTLKTA